MKIYTIQAVMTIRENAFKKAVKDIRVAFSNFSHIEIRNIIKKIPCEILVNYIENDVFPFDFE